MDTDYVKRATITLDAKEASAVIAYLDEAFDRLQWRPPTVYELRTALEKVV